MGTDFYRDVHPADDKAIVNEETDSLNSQPRNLTNFIRSQRLKVASGMETTKAGVEKIRTEYDIKEKKINKEISTIYSDDHGKLAPGLAYIAVAMMTGSIFTRRAHMGLKMSTPLLFGLCTAVFVFPSTTRNIKNNFYSFEKRHFPIIAKKHEEIRGELREGLEDCHNFVNKTKGIVNEWFK